MPVNVQAYKTTCTNFIEELISNLGNQYPERDLDVLSALATIFDVRNYPLADRMLRDHGNEALQLLSERFGQPVGSELVSPENLLNQFLQLKYTMRAHGPVVFVDTVRSYRNTTTLSLPLPCWQTSHWQFL